ALQQIDAARQQLELLGLQEVVQLAVGIAGRVVKRQGAIDPDVLAANLAEAMKLVTHAQDLRIIIHPSQRSCLEQTLPRLQLQWPVLEHAAILEDEAIAPGGCQLATAHGIVD